MKKKIIISMIIAGLIISMAAAFAGCGTTSAKKFYEQKESKENVGHYEIVHLLKSKFLEVLELQGIQVEDLYLSLPTMSGPASVWYTAELEVLTTDGEVKFFNLVDENCTNLFYKLVTEEGDFHIETPDHLDMDPVEYLVEVTFDFNSEKQEIAFY